jgi:hypothetical protein
MEQINRQKRPHISSNAQPESRPLRMRNPADSTSARVLVRKRAGFVRGVDTDVTVECTELDEHPRSFWCANHIYGPN